MKRLFLIILSIVFFENSIFAMEEARALQGQRFYKSQYEQALQENNFGWILDNIDELINKKIVSADRIYSILKTYLNTEYEKALTEGNIEWISKNVQNLLGARVVGRDELMSTLAIYGISMKTAEEEAAERIQKLEQARKKADSEMRGFATRNYPQRALIPIINLYKELRGTDSTYAQLSALTQERNLRVLYDRLLELLNNPDIKTSVAEQISNLCGYMRFGQWIDPMSITPEIAIIAFKQAAESLDINAMIDFYQNFLRMSEENEEALQESSNRFQQSIAKNDIQAMTDIYLNILQNSSMAKEALDRLKTYAQTLRNSEQLTRLMIVFEKDPFMNELKSLITAVKVQEGEPVSSVAGEVDFPGGLAGLQQAYEEARANRDIDRLLELQDQLISSGIIQDAQTFEAVINSLMD